MDRKRILAIVIFIIILVAIPATLYLVRQTQIFKPKAAFVPKVEFIDATGKVMSETDSRDVKLRITREEVTPSPSPSPAVSPSPSPSSVVSPSPSPSPSPSVSPSPSPSPAVVSKRVFVTSTTYNGNLGGLAGADQKCQDRANATNLGGSWKAWLSDSQTSSASRLTHHTTPYKRLDGATVALDWTDLTDGTLDNPISVSEINTLAQGFVWTNTKSDGTILSADKINSTCADWQGASSALGGRGGQIASSDGKWTDNQGTPFNCEINPSHLYCFEQ